MKTSAKHNPKKRSRAALVLSDGRIFKGRLIGKLKKEGRIGEVVFNTSMTGYQEIITDPSYLGQFVCFTYPSIGNYGINTRDNQSERPWLEGIIIRDYNEVPSNFQSVETLEDFLVRYELPALTDVDTRALVRHIRESGSQQAGLFLLPEAAEEDGLFLDKMLARVRKAPSMEGANLTDSFDGRAANQFIANWLATNRKNREGMIPVAALDFGIKFAILEGLLENNIYPTVFAGNKPIAEQPGFVIDKFAGFFFSNGPGDPAAVTVGIANIKQLIETGKPCFGICLGHQMLSLALGGQTFKMKFGHHGGNQPVKASYRKQVIITAQNHGFSIDEETLRSAYPEVTKNFERNPNDDSAEGFLLCGHGKNILSVQYHPEAAPGPHDARVVFREFREMLEKAR